VSPAHATIDLPPALHPWFEAWVAEADRRYERFLADLDGWHHQGIVLGLDQLVERHPRHLAALDDATRATLDQMAAAFDSASAALASQAEVAAAEGDPPGPAILDAETTLAEAGWRLVEAAGRQAVAVDRLDALADWAVVELDRLERYARLRAAQRAWQRRALPSPSAVTQVIEPEPLGPSEAPTVVVDGGESWPEMLADPDARVIEPSDQTQEIR
jgi:hypothetical protein